MEGGKDKKDIPSENAGMSNDKGIIPRLKLMEFHQVTASKFVNLSQRIKR